MFGLNPVNDEEFKARIICGHPAGKIVFYL